MREVQGMLQERGFKCSTPTLSALERHGQGGPNLKDALAKLYSESEKTVQKTDMLSLNEPPGEELDAAVDRAINELLNIKMHLNQRKQPHGVSYGPGRKHSSADPAKVPVPPAQAKYDSPRHEDER